MIRTRSAAALVLEIHPDTLKRWEDEGIVPECERDSTGRRLYTEMDLAKLKQIADERKQAYGKLKWRPIAG